jgi:hypothetical protein
LGYNMWKGGTFISQKFILRAIDCTCLLLNISL